MLDCSPTSTFLRVTLLRRAYASGAHSKVVQERLGHSGIVLDLNTYSHVIPGMQERATARLDALLSTKTKTARA